MKDPSTFPGSGEPFLELEAPGDLVKRGWLEGLPVNALRGEETVVAIPC